MKCSEDDDLRQYLDKAQDLFACLNDMGAKMADLDFLLSSYESVMNALTISLEEVGKPIEINSVIRILKAQYNKRRTQSTSQEEQGFMGVPSKKAHICTNCKKKGHSIEKCWAKGSGKEAQGPKQKKMSKSRKKREREGECSCRELQ